MKSVEVKKAEESSSSPTNRLATTFGSNATSSGKRIISTEADKAKGRLGEALNGWFWSFKNVLFANVLNSTPATTTTGAGQNLASAPVSLRPTSGSSSASSRPGECCEHRFLLRPRKSPFPGWMPLSLKACNQV